MSLNTTFTIGQDSTTHIYNGGTVDINKSVTNSVKINIKIVGSKRLKVKTCIATVLVWLLVRLTGFKVELHYENT